MNTVITLVNVPDEWYQDTFICCECSAEFMIDADHPRFCPCCGVKFDAIRKKYTAEEGGMMETIFVNDEKEVNEDGKNEP